MTNQSDESYSLIDHTADLGFEAHAYTLPALMEQAAYALYSIITDKANIRKDHHLRVEIPLDTPEENLRYWLEELLFRFNSADYIFTHFSVTEEGSHLVGIAAGEPFDPERHIIYTEIKGITYHQFEVKETSEGWKARVILDV
ncbi:MAG: archease [Fidelibacterota bacterium]